MRKIARSRRLVPLALGVWGLTLATTPVFAQLDPLLFIKRVPPTVIIVVDNSIRMLEDGDGNFHDPRTYNVADQSTVAQAMGVNTVVATRYRRVYQKFDFTNVQDASQKYEVTDIDGVGDDEAGFDTFYATPASRSPSGASLQPSVRMPAACTDGG